MKSHNTFSSDSRSSVSSISSSLISTSSSSSINDSESSTSSTSTSSISTTTSSVSSSHATCFFDGTTQINQKFSIPEKILYYMAKNPKNASVYQKLIQTCKYFFALNPIIVAPVLVCVKKEWFACERFECFGELYKYCKINDIPTKFKIWLSRSIDTNFEDVSRLSPLIPRIYRSDAIEITLLYCESSPIGFFYDAPVQKVKKFITFHDFLFFAANAERIVLDNRSIKYENGDTVLFETIIKSLPKLKWLYYESDDGKDITSNSAFNLMEDFKGFSYLNLNGFTEKLDVETIFDFIIKNKHIEFNLHYHPDLSFPFKELVRKYSKLLLNESQCQSTIKFPRMDYDNISDLEGLDIDDEE